MSNISPDFEGHSVEDMNRISDRADLQGKLLKWGTILFGPAVLGVLTAFAFSSPGIGSVVVMAGYAGEALYIGMHPEVWA